MSLQKRRDAYQCFTLLVDLYEFVGGASQLAYYVLYLHPMGCSLLCWRGGVSVTGKLKAKSTAPKNLKSKIQNFRISRNRRAHDHHSTHPLRIPFPSSSYLHGKCWHPSHIHPCITHLHSPQSKKVKKTEGEAGGEAAAGPQLGPQRTHPDENVFATAHIYASFNDTFVVCGTLSNNFIMY